MQYWTPGTKQRNLLSDGILWSARPQTEKEINVLSKVNDAEIAHYTSWRHYRQVMMAASQETWTRRKQWKRSKWLGYISPVTKVFKSRTWYNSNQHYNKLDYYSTIREVCCHRSNSFDWLLPCYFLSCGFRFQHSRRSFPEFFATCVSWVIVSFFDDLSFVFQVFFLPWPHHVMTAGLHDLAGQFCLYDPGQVALSTS